MDADTAAEVDGGAGPCGIARRRRPRLRIGPSPRRGSVSRTAIDSRPGPPAAPPAQIQTARRRRSVSGGSTRGGAVGVLWSRGRTGRRCRRWSATSRSTVPAACRGGPPPRHPGRAGRAPVARERARRAGRWCPSQLRWLTYGTVAVVPDWRSDELRVGADELLASIGFATAHATGLGGDPGRLVLAGWSLGASAVVDIALHPDVAGGWHPTAVVGLGGGYDRTPSPGPPEPRPDGRQHGRRGRASRTGGPRDGRPPDPGGTLRRRRGRARRGGVASRAASGRHRPRRGDRYRVRPAAEAVRPVRRPRAPRRHGGRWPATWPASPSGPMDLPASGSGRPGPFGACDPDWRVNEVRVDRTAERWPTDSPPLRLASSPVRITYFGVRGSCPCFVRPAAALRGEHLLCPGRGGRRATPDPRHGDGPARARPPPQRAAARRRQAAAGQCAPDPSALRPCARHPVLPADARSRVPCSRSTARPRRDESLQATMAGMVKPPFFPVHMADFRGELSYHDLRANDEFASSVGSPSRPARSPTSATPSDSASRPTTSVVAYLPDHQAPRRPDARWRTQCSNSATGRTC